MSFCRITCKCKIVLCKDCVPAGPDILCFYYDYTIAMFVLQHKTAVLHLLPHLKHEGHHVLILNINLTYNCKFFPGFLK